MLASRMPNRMLAAVTSHQRTVPGTLVELLSTASDRHGSELAEIEQFLCSHPAVVAAKVVGVASPGGSDVAVAYVQLAAGAATSTDELTAFCRDQLAPFKVPAHVNVIDEFPTTTGTNGTKIVTAELRRRAERQVAGSPL